MKHRLFEAIQKAEQKIEFGPTKVYKERLEKMIKDNAKKQGIDFNKVDRKKFERSLKLLASIVATKDSVTDKFKLF